MSAFLSSPDTLSALVTYWAAKASAPGSYSTPADSLLRAYQFSCRARSGSSGDLVIDDEVATLIGANNPAKAADTAYRILLLENQRSLAARYPDDDGYRAAGARYTYRRLPIVQFWLSTQATGQLVGLLRGYAYQSCEHDGWETSTARKLCDQIERWLLGDLEAKDCGPNGGNWASWEAPEDPRAVAMREALANA